MNLNGPKSEDNSDEEESGEADYYGDESGEADYYGDESGEADFDDESGEEDMDDLTSEAEEGIAEMMGERLIGSSDDYDSEESEQES